MNIFPLNLHDNLQFIKHMDSSNTLLSNVPQFTPATLNLNQASGLISFPVSLPTNKTGDCHQALQIQMINPNAITSFQPKFQLGPVNFTGNQFNPTGTTVVTVAYNSQESEIITNQTRLNNGKYFKNQIRPNF